MLVRWLAQPPADAEKFDIISRLAEIARSLAVISMSSTPLMTYTAEKARHCGGEAVKLPPFHISTLQLFAPQAFQSLSAKAFPNAMQLFSSTGLTWLILPLVTIIAMTTAAAIPAEDSATSLLAKRYAGGRCGIHVTQYQSAAGVAVIVKDNNQSKIGEIGRTNFNNGYVNVFSQLPYSIVVHLVGGGQLEFAYAGDHWSTTDGRCSVGGYQGGARQMDCGFAC
ncbi:hypothetical protein MMC07_004274 [Pseudocyphellaria aurata]|nr:hypothetical protein [Pseudocyphellaria aurata]